MSRRPPTDKHNLYSHILALHTTGIDNYDRVTYRELQAYHYHQHRQGLATNHYHAGQGLDPVERPEGWNDGGAAVTRKPAIDQVPHSIPDSRGNRVRVEGVDRCWCGCKYWENDACVDCGGTEVQPAT